MGFLKLLFVAAGAGIAIAVAKSGKKSTDFVIDVLANWGERTATVTVTQKGTQVFSSVVQLDGNSADSFGKRNADHTIKLTRNRQKGVYLVSVYQDENMVAGSLIDFLNQKVTDL